MNKPLPDQRPMMVDITILPQAIAPLNRINQKINRIWISLSLTVKKFLQIGSAQWAAAFAFNAFFSLFPLMILLVTITSSFVDRDKAGKVVITYIESYLPITGDMQRHIFATITGVIESRNQAGIIALLILVWVALQCFTTLIYATNRAWGTAMFNWWRLPLKSLALLCITGGAVLLGMMIPVLMNITGGRIAGEFDFHSRLYSMGSFLVPLLVMFSGLSLFYKIAPHRPTKFAEVWIAALCATLLLRASAGLFMIYLYNYTTLNAVYGTFGGIMALLLWIYLSGCIFIFGACLCAIKQEAKL